MPKKAGEEASAEPVAHHFGRILAAALDIGIAWIFAVADHQCAHHQHEQSEQEQQALSVHGLAQGRAGISPRDACGGKHAGTPPFDRAGPRVRHEAGAGIDRHCQCAGADRDMRLGHAHQIDHERDGEDRTAPSDQAEREPDKAAGPRTEQILNGVERHRVRAG